MPPIDKTYELDTGHQQEISVYAIEKYSLERFKVKSGQQYVIASLPKQWWWDSYVPSTPGGFFNILAVFMDMRVRGRIRGAKCFRLCASFNLKDHDAIAIGSNGNIIIPQGRDTLSFFANDVDTEPRYERFRENNRGSIRIVVKRVA